MFCMQLTAPDLAVAGWLACWLTRLAIRQAEGVPAISYLLYLHVFQQCDIIASTILVLILL